MLHIDRDVSGEQYKYASRGDTALLWPAVCALATTAIDIKINSEAATRAEGAAIREYEIDA